MHKQREQEQHFDEFLLHKQREQEQHFGEFLMHKQREQEYNNHNSDGCKSAFVSALTENWNNS